MKRQQLRWIFGLTILASLSLVGLQGYIWHQGIQQERAQFSRSIQHAVFEAAEEFMTPQESVFIVDDSQFEDSLKLKTPGFIMLQIGKADTNFSINLRGQAISESFGEPVTEDVVQVGQLAVVEQVHKYQLELPDSSRVLRTSPLADPLNNNFFIRHQRLCPDCTPGFSHKSAGSFKPLLQKELEQLGIDSPFEWGILHRNDWLIVEGDTANLEHSEWQFPFFSLRTPQSNLVNELSQSPDISRQSPSSPYVLLHFPSEQWYLLRSMGPTLLFSSLLALFVLGCIGYAVFVILEQKQLSEVKTDFINNMTHELKTPISTIALACEAMQDQQVELPESSKNHYLNMIAAENERLGSQVEKVLQMALLDKKDLGLNMEPVNIHWLLEDVIEAFSLQLKQRKGQISTSLNATSDLVQGDMMHLRQMFANLLDNANKYSPNAPDIQITTTSVKGGIEIAIKDQGVGISRDSLRKIFDRFYRVPTGNLHDVKGFGLGLSYVQTMAMAHGGHVHAKSKLGTGSTFYLFLPYPNG